MSFSLVFSPYNSPTFASKQAQWSKLENVMPVKNELNANVYFLRSSFSDSSLDSHLSHIVSLFTLSDLTADRPRGASLYICSAADGLILKVYIRHKGCLKCVRASHNCEGSIKKRNQCTMQMSIITFSPLSTRPILITP